MEKTCLRLNGSLAYPSYPSRAIAMKISYSSLQNLKNCLREKKNVGLAERLAHLTGWPFSDGKVNLLAEPARSKPDHQNMRERCCKLLARAIGSTRNARLSWLGWEERVTLFQGATFLLNVA